MINHNLRNNIRSSRGRKLAAKAMMVLCIGSLMGCQAKAVTPSETVPLTTPEETQLPTPEETQLPTPEETQFPTTEVTQLPTPEETQAPTEPFDPQKRPNLVETASLDAPTASHSSGMYKDAIELSFEVPEGQYLYYTTDGSDPRTSSTAQLYTKPLTIRDRTPEDNVLHSIRPGRLSADYVKDTMTFVRTKVDKATVVRAFYATETGQFSPVTSHTYLIGLDNARYNDLVVVSLSTDHDSLFDFETGIYVLGKVFDEWRISHPREELNGSTPANYNQRGKAWEREAYMEVFGTDGTVLLSQGCGIRTQGGWSRSAWQKSFRMIARKAYGAGNFSAEVFDDLQRADGTGALTTFDTLLLRNGGNDAGFSKLKDTVLQGLVHHRNFETQTGRPAVLFLNGEYWGLYTLIEYYDADYFKNNYGVDPDNVCFYKNYDMDEGTEEDNGEFWQMLEMIGTSDPSKQEDYDRINSVFDIDSFIDYMATEIYINNQDWPGGNFGMWKVRTPEPDNPYADGRWHMTLFDTEYSTNMYGDRPTAKGCWQNNNLKRVLEEGNIISDIFKSLIRNDGFKEKFTTTLLDLMNVEYEYDRYEELLEYYKAQYFPELVRHFEAFPGWMTVENCAIPTTERMSEFMKLRPTYVPKMLKSTLKLEGEAIAVEVSSNVANANIQVNSSTAVLKNGSWTGTYFTDYSITLTALPMEGYHFAGWKVSGDNTIQKTEGSTITIKASGNNSVYATYEKN